MNSSASRRRFLRGLGATIALPTLECSSVFAKGGDAKREVCTEVLERIADSMRSVIVSAPDYQTLKIIHTARRLYRSKYNSFWEKQDLSRRFAEGYKRLLMMSDGNPPDE